MSNTPSLVNLDESALTTKSKKRDTLSDTLILKLNAFLDDATEIVKAEKVNHEAVVLFRAELYEKLSEYIAYNCTDKVARDRCDPVAVRSLLEWIRYTANDQFGPQHRKLFLNSDAWKARLQALIEEAGG